MLFPTLRPAPEKKTSDFWAAPDLDTSSFQSVPDLDTSQTTSLPLKPKSLPFSLLCSQIVLQVFFLGEICWVNSKLQ